MVWFSVAIGLSSLVALLITLFHVIPAYLVFSRSREAMMLERFGGEYRENVGALLPRPPTR